MASTAVFSIRLPGKRAENLKRIPAACSAQPPKWPPKFVDEGMRQAILPGSSSAISNVWAFRPNSSGCIQCGAWDGALARYGSVLARRDFFWSFSGVSAFLARLPGGNRWVTTTSIMAPLA